MGVVSGIVMSYQFGTNWSVFSDRAGPIIGPLMAYEVLTAFFLEAGLPRRHAVRDEPGREGAAFHRDLHGRDRHLHLRLLDPVGEQLDAHADRLGDQRGRPVRAGRTAGSTIIFNPSFPYRLVHTVLAAYLTTALVVGGVGAWHLLRAATRRRCGRCSRWRCGCWPWSRRSRSSSATCTGSTRCEHQPAKVMAMEGHFQSHPEGAPLILFGMPDEEARDGALCGRDPAAFLADPEA